MAVVAVLKTKPETILKDYQRLMQLAEYQKFIKKNKETILKLNLSWSLYFPSCSTEPWQLEGILKTMLKDGFSRDKILATENKTVVTDVYKGLKGNKWDKVLGKYKIRFVPLPEVEWVTYKPKHGMLALDKIFPEGHKIPKMFIGKNVLHLPTMKCVHPDTLISTSEGLIKIRDMFGSPSSGASEESKEFGKRVLTFVGRKKKDTIFAKAKVWRNMSEGKIYRVRLKTGKEVIVSSEHPFLTQEGWVKASDLKKEVHKIASLRQTPSFRAKSVKLNLKQMKIKKAHNIIKLPKKSSPELCRWLAYVISEGSIENREAENYAIHFTNYSQELATDFNQITTALFGIAFKEKKTRKHEFFFHSKQLVDVLKQLGALENNKKRIPYFIYACSDSEIVDFLTTYIECDGAINPTLPQITITTTNKKDAQLLLLLFQRIGIVAFLTRRTQHKYKDIFNISIYGDEISRFNRLVPNFRKDENKQKFKEALARLNKKKNKFLTNYDFIPIKKEHFAHIFKKLPKFAEPFARRERGNRFWQSVVYYKKRIPRKSLKYLVNALRYKLISLNKYKPDDFEYLNFLLNDAIIWEDIIEIVSSNAKMELYDITVLEDSHNFVGNGILLHNTHGHTQMTGAIKNAFGGLITEKRHHCHKMIHEILVDLLQIQKEIHPGIFAVMDGSVCGDGSGPRTMVPKIKNYILASADQAAIDAIAAKMMGFEPLKIPFIKIAHDKGLGCGDPDQIDLVGIPRKDFNQINFRFKTKKSPVIFFDQLFRKKISLTERILFHTKLFRLAIFGSEFYHDKLWYPTIGKYYINKFIKTDWGKLWQKY